MPFLRYDLGDIGILSDEACPCGRNLPLLKYLEGREDDFFVLPNGESVSPSVVVNQVKLIPGLRQFRIVQESLRDFYIYLLPGNSFSQKSIDEVQETIQKIMKVDLNMNVQVVEKMPDDPSGKIRSLISKVRRNF